MNNEEVLTKSEYGVEDKTTEECFSTPIEHIKTEEENKIVISTTNDSSSWYCFKCPFHGCPFTTNTLKLYKEHKKHHIIKGHRKCLYCSFSSNKQSTLTWHLLHHVEAQNTKTPPALKEENVGTTMLYCSFPWCPFSSNSYVSLKRHQSKHSNRTFRCHYCMFKCNRKNLLKAHLRQHEERDSPISFNDMEMNLDVKPKDTDKSQMSKEKNAKHDFLRKFLKYDKWSMRIYLQCPKCPYKKRCSKKKVFFEHLQKHTLTAIGTKCSFCTYKGNVKGIKVHELIHLDRKMRLKKDWCSIIRTKLSSNGLKKRDYIEKSDLLSKPCEDISIESKDIEITCPIPMKHTVDNEDFKEQESCRNMQSAVHEQNYTALNKTNNQEKESTISYVDNVECDNADSSDNELVNKSKDSEGSNASSKITTIITDESDKSSAKNDIDNGTERCIIQDSVAGEDLSNVNLTDTEQDKSNRSNQSITITITTSETCNNADLIKQVLVSEILKKFDSDKSSINLSCDNINNTNEEFSETTQQIHENSIEASPVHNESLFSNEFEMFVDFAHDVKSEFGSFIGLNEQSESEENCLQELISNDCLSLFEVSTGAEQISSLENDWSVTHFDDSIQSSIDLPNASNARLSTNSTSFKEIDGVIIVFDSDEECQSEVNKKKEPKRKVPIQKPALKTGSASLTNETSKKQTYKCNLCPAKFSIQSQLAIHNMLHFAGAGLKCPLCSYTNSKTNILKHLLCHVISNEGIFKCPLCDTTKRNIEYMNDHFKVVHSSHIFQPHEAVCKKRFCSGCCGKSLPPSNGINRQKLTALPLNCIDLC